MNKLLQALLIIASVVCYGLDMIEIEKAIYMAILSICLNVLNQTEGGDND